LVLHYDTFKLSSTDAGCEQWPDLGIVLSYWTLICDGCQAPSWSVFDILHIPHRLIPNSVVCDYDSKLDDLTFRFWGTGMATMFHLEVTGTKTSEWTGKGLFRPLVDGFKRLQKMRRPFVNINEIELIHGRKILAPVLRLPLSSNGTHIDGMVAVNDFGVNTEELRSHFEEQAEID
jgi:hypothetical protein